MSVFMFGELAMRSEDATGYAPANALRIRTRRYPAVRTAILPPAITALPAGRQILGQNMKSRPVFNRIGAAFREPCLILSGFRVILRRNQFAAAQRLPPPFHPGRVSMYIR
jgi:hypothetical protein